MSRSRRRPRRSRSADKFSVHIPFCDEGGRGCTCKWDLARGLVNREKRRAIAFELKARG